MRERKDKGTGLVVGLVVGLGACTLDTRGLGYDGTEGSADAAGSTTMAEASETALASADSAGTSHGGGVLDSGGFDTGTSTTGDGHADTSSDGSTGEASIPMCVPETGLAACYDFEGVGSGMLVDLSGQGNHAPVVGVGVVPGPFGSAALFDGGSQIAVPDSPSLDIAGPLTLEAWIRVDALPPFGRMGVLDNELQYAVTIHADDRYRCNVSNGTAWAQGVVVGPWSHLACVYDGITLRLYVDGVERGITSASGSVSTWNQDPMSIGDTSPAFDEPLRGAIGGLRVWSMARSPEQICESAGELCER